MAKVDSGENFYEILGLPRDAASSDIARAFRTLAKSLHPDRFSVGNPVSSDFSFQQVSEAYEVLKDPVKRGKYDDELDKRRRGLIPPASAQGSHPAGKPRRFNAGIAIGIALIGLAAFLAGREQLRTAPRKIQDALSAAQSASALETPDSNETTVPERHTLSPEAISGEAVAAGGDGHAAEAAQSGTPVSEELQVPLDGAGSEPSTSADTSPATSSDSASDTVSTAESQEKALPPASGLARSVVALEDAIDNGGDKLAGYRLYLGVTSASSLADLASAAAAARKEETKALIGKTMDRLRDARLAKDATRDREAALSGPQSQLASSSPGSGSQDLNVRDPVAHEPRSPNSEKPPAFAFVSGTRGHDTVLRLRPGQGILESFADCPSCPDMVVIPAGEYVMGARFAEGLSPSLSPAHRVLVRKEFAISKFEISNAEMKECTLAGGCGGWSSTMFAQRDWPATRLSFADAKAYAAWLTLKTGKRYRLLSEAEWEYVARSGSGSPAGGAARWRSDVERVNYGDFLLYPNLLHSARRFPPNAWGVVNMRGNAMTWTEDCWHASYDRSPSDTAPWLEGQGGDCRYRSIRGGNIGDRPGAVAETGRARERGDTKAPLIGLRIARDLPPPETAAVTQGDATAP